MFGISAALTTPYLPDGSVDTARLNDHINTVLGEGCNSVTFFGTTGEGPCIDTATRLATVKASIDAGIDPAQFVLSLHGNAAADITQQAKSALDMGVKQYLLPPPSYYGDPATSGLHDWFKAILVQLDSTGAQIILYHIPQVIGVHLPNDLVARLKSEFPALIYGVKDSSGNFDNTKELLEMADLHIMIGDERTLAAGVKLGASGSISGMANLYSARLTKVLASGENDTALNSLIDTVLQFPVTPAIKSLVAHKYDAPVWRQTKAPLLPISDQDHATLAAAYDALDPTG